MFCCIRPDGMMQIVYNVTAKFYLFSIRSLYAAVQYTIHVFLLITSVGIGLYNLSDIDLVVVRMFETMPRNSIL